MSTKLGSWKRCFCDSDNGFRQKFVSLAVYTSGKSCSESEATIIDNGFGDARPSAAAIGKFEDVERIRKKRELQSAIKVLEISEISLLYASNAIGRWRHYVFVSRRQNSTTTTKRELKQQCKKPSSYTINGDFKSFKITLEFYAFN